MMKFDFQSDLKNDFHLNKDDKNQKILIEDKSRKYFTGKESTSCFWCKII
jgi:hypothetical protein